MIDGKVGNCTQLSKQGWRKDGHSRKLKLYLLGFCCQEELLQEEGDDRAVKS